MLCVAWSGSLSAATMETNLLVARGDSWHYNDSGADLTFSPWKLPKYDDHIWPLGRAPFGYGTAVTTTNSFGSASTNKFPTYYYRKVFNVDVAPATLCLNLRRDDGAVVYLNGREVYCINVTNDPITFVNWASVAVEGADETNYFHIDLPATNVVVGANILAVEVHQVAPADSDLAFDLELLGIGPLTPRIHAVAATRIEPQSDAVPGDLLQVAVTVTNLGNATENVTILLKDTNSNQLVASASISALAVGSATTLLLDWQTLGFAPGDYTLQVFTVLDGQTNLSGTASGPAILRDTGFSLNAANVAGSLGGYCGAVTTVGDHLLVGAGATLEVWNLCNPALPVKVGSLRLPGLIKSIAATNSFAFVACGNAGVQFVDISNSSAPVHRKTFDSSGHAYCVAVSGTSLFLADGRSGVRVFDISSPASPILIGAFHTSGPARSLTVAGDSVFVLDHYRGLLILNAANPQALTLSGGYELFDAGEALATSGALACIATGGGRLLVLNLTNGPAPSLAGSLVLNGVGRAIALNGNLAYVAAGGAGLFVIDVANPSAPALLRTLSTPGQAADIVAVGPRAYLANGLAGVEILDLNQPEAPVVATELGTGLRGADVAIANGLAYVAAGEAGFRVYSITNPAAPVLVGSNRDALNARSVALSGSVAGVGDGQYGLKLVDVSNPANPVLRGSFTDTNLGSIRSVAADGARVALTDGKLVLLVDAANPANPVLLGSYTAPAFAYALAATNGYIYAACGNYGVLILTSSNGLSIAGRYDTAGLATSIAVSSQRAYVADGQAGWLVLDIANPAAPALLKASVHEAPVREVAIAGTLAVLANAAPTIRSVDITTPLTPVPRAVFGPLTRAMRLAAEGRYALAAEDESGVAILDLDTRNVPLDGDQDGLVDGWEQQIVDADPADAIRTVQEVRPENDFDGDGASNRQEYLAGTNPTDASSVFVAAVHRDVAPSTVNVRWRSVPGKVYTLYKATDLNAGFQVLQDDIAATPPMNSFRDTAQADKAFYIIIVK